MRTFLLAAVGLCLQAVAFNVAAQDTTQKMRMTGATIGWAAESGRLRQVLQAFPKGGDLHNHLSGAIYAETWLDWAAADGWYVNKNTRGIVSPDEVARCQTDKACDASGMILAKDALADETIRARLIDAMSNRNYVPTLDWSGHDDFFAIFPKTAAKEDRFGDKLAAVAERAAQQNILYLELMETTVLGELFPLVGGIELSGDVDADYKTLMASPFAAKIPDAVAFIRSEIQSAQAKKARLLGCNTDPDAMGCDVEIRFIHQVIREFEPSVVYAQIILGWAVMDQVDEVVALNLVAPEDGYIALRDYSYHMRMIDHLYTTLGERNVTLHAGELTMGLVRPRQLRFHIREAIELGHAKRIGHGIDIAYETDSENLMKKMAAEGIMVEINLTSNDMILGVSGKDHPIEMYRDLDVPYALSTDDEGVSRIDLTHEYMRFMTSYDVPYQELKYASRNSLTYSFLNGDSLWTNDDCKEAVRAWSAPGAGCGAFLETSEKARLQWELELRFRKYENTLRIPERKRKSFN